MRADSVALENSKAVYPWRLRENQKLAIQRAVTSLGSCNLP